jgi:hypothetical protein
VQGLAGGAWDALTARIPKRDPDGVMPNTEIEIKTQRLKNVKLN